VVAAAARGAARVTVKTKRQVTETQRGVVRGGKRFGEAVWGPLARLSGVLWLEVTGAFFGIFALFAGQATWTHRVDLVSSADRSAHLRAMVFLGMALLFGYFCVTSFVRARRRERSR
jgi:hypothetical protein